MTTFTEAVKTIRNRIVNEIESTDENLKNIADSNGENNLPLNLTVNFRTNNGGLEYQFDRTYDIPENIKRLITKIINEEA